MAYSGVATFEPAIIANQAAPTTKNAAVRARPAVTVISRTLGGGPLVLADG
jgi:hypothetical protein